MIIPHCVRNVQLIVNAWAVLHLTWYLVQQRHLVHSKQHNTCGLGLDYRQMCIITFIILWQQSFIGTNEKMTFYNFIYIFFLLVNENLFSSLADSVKHDGKAPASSKAKARKGKLAVLSKTDSKGALVRWQRQRGSFMLFIYLTGKSSWDERVQGRHLHTNPRWKLQGGGEREIQTPPILEIQLFPQYTPTVPWSVVVI